MAVVLEKEVFILLKTYPVEEKFGMADQMRRSSASVCDNIAEGYGKFSYQSKIQSFYIARGEAEEIRSQIERSFNKELLDEDRKNEMILKYTELIKGINGYINFLKKEKVKNPNA